MTDARNDILSAVRRITGDHKDVVASRLVAHAPNLMPQRAADDALVIPRFAEEAERAGTEVRLAASVDDIPAVIEVFLKSLDLDGGVRLSGDPLISAVPWGNAPGLSPKTGAAEPSDTASLGVALCGIAETGTVMMTSSPESPAMLNYLPYLSVAVLAESRIVGSMESAWAILRDQPETSLPRIINFITGPSRTADIEQELLMGAHGPQQHMVIILRDA